MSSKIRAEVALGASSLRQGEERDCRGVPASGEKGGEGGGVALHPSLTLPPLLSSVAAPVSVWHATEYLSLAPPLLDAYF